MNKHYAIATGHSETTKAAQTILEAGGNAFDAIIAGLLAACVAEPVLASLGGGGFLLAQTKDKTELYDFFVQTPREKKENPDFYPIIADFGDTQQEFHIGMGAAAVPGCVKGIFTLHQKLGKMPFREIIQPAVLLARQGLEVNSYQSFLFDIVEKIYQESEEARKIFASQKEPQKLKRPGERLKMENFANFLEELSREGDKLFYEGEVAQKIAKLSAERGGHLSLEDLKNYQVKIRKPLEINFQNYSFLTNCPPSAGGIFISFALKLAEKTKWPKISGSPDYLKNLILILEATNLARKEKLNNRLGEEGITEEFLDPALLKLYWEKVQGNYFNFHGTTHLSIIDAEKNIASLTVTNGEGNGVIIPNTDIMLNNMLGEEDLNPSGFNKWPENTRVSSMAAPSILAGEKVIALGSAGSNRIKSAILQTALQLAIYHQDLAAAIAHPRIHWENGQLNVEKGFSAEAINFLKENFPQATFFQGKSLFFGGVNAVGFSVKQGYFAASDERRQGAALVK